MDSQWDLRSIYEQARLVKVAQDEWCESAQAGETAGLGRYPESPLKLEALVSCFFLSFFLLYEKEGIADEKALG